MRLMIDHIIHRSFDIELGSTRTFHGEIFPDHVLFSCLMVASQPQQHTSIGRRVSALAETPFNSFVDAFIFLFAVSKKKQYESINMHEAWRKLTTHPVWQMPYAAHAASGPPLAEDRNIITTTQKKISLRVEELTFIVYTCRAYTFFFVGVW